MEIYLRNNLRFFNEVQGEDKINSVSLLKKSLYIFAELQHGIGSIYHSIKIASKES
jgi:hypothetical protein